MTLLQKVLKLDLMPCFKTIEMLTQLTVFRTPTSEVVHAFLLGFGKHSTNAFPKMRQGIILAFDGKLFVVFLVILPYCLSNLSAQPPKL